jgi:hypothetical protein
MFSQSCKKIEFWMEQLKKVSIRASLSKLSTTSITTTTTMTTIRNNNVSVVIFGGGESNVKRVTERDLCKYIKTSMDDVLSKSKVMISDLDYSYWFESGAVCVDLFDCEQFRKVFKIYGISDDKQKRTLLRVVSEVESNLRYMLDRE